MEDGSALGTYLAYGAIALFLLLIALVVLRTMMLAALLLLSPARDVWTWLSGATRRRQGR